MSSCRSGESFNWWAPALMLLIASILVTEAQGHHSLTIRQIQALQATGALSDINYRVLTKKINGKEKTVVLIGESYIKDKAELKALNQVTHQFPFYGFDGVNFHNYWAEGMAIRAMLLTVDAGLNFFSEPSVKSIYAENKSTALKLSDVCRALKQSEGGRELGVELKKGEKTRVIAGRHLNTGRLGSIHQEFSKEKFCGTENGDSVYLEDGVAISMMANLAMLFVPAYFSAVKLGQCSKILSMRLSSSRKLKLMHGGIMFFLKWLGIYVGVDFLSRLFFGADSWQDNLFIVSTGLYYSRNENIAEGIIKGFKDHPEQKNMLAVIKYIHLDAVDDLLVKDYGFARPAL